MKKFCVIAAVAAAALGLGSLAAQASVAPSIGEAAKAAVQDSTAAVVSQVNWRRHHHRRSYVYIVPRVYGYRFYGRRR